MASFAVLHAVAACRAFCGFLAHAYLSAYLMKVTLQEHVWFEGPTNVTKAAVNLHVQFGLYTHVQLSLEKHQHVCLSDCVSPVRDLFSFTVGTSTCLGPTKCKTFLFFSFLVYYLFFLFFNCFY